jgi:hypothetical protein
VKTIEDMFNEIKDVKDSLEIGLKPDTSFSPFYEYRLALQLCLDEYIKKYPFLQRVDNFNITEGYNIQSSILWNSAISRSNYL